MEAKLLYPSVPNRFSHLRQWPLAAKIAATTAAVVVATLIRHIGRPILGAELWFILFYPVVVFCTFMGDLPCGALATILLGASLGYFIHTDSALTLTESLVIISSLLLEGFALSLLLDRLLKRMRTTYEQRIAQMSVFINEAPAAIAMFDRKMRYLAVSRRWLRDFQIEGKAVLGRSHYEIFPELPERWKEVHRRCLAGAVERAEEDLFIREDGRRQWISWEVHPWMTDARDATIGGILIFSEDITHLKDAHEHESTLRSHAAVETALRIEAERSIKEKDDFIATLSHELRTPLNALLGWTHLLKRAPQDPTRQTQALEAIERSASLLAQLISDILDINRIAAGKLRLNLEQISLRSLLEQAMQISLPQAELKEIALLQEPPDADITIPGDSTRLQQCLLNLLSNAIKFTPRGGRITLATQISDDAARISVRDTGQGIQPDALPHIFERFAQADPSSTRVHGGLGLGLAIVRHLVELHGGSIRAESEGRDRGSTFTITLPRGLYARGKPALMDADEALIGTIDWRGLTFLVVDDELEAREILRGTLEDHGAHVLTAASADDALTIASQHRLDLIISDISMPLRDGYSLIKDIRALRIETPAIALTAYGGDAHVRRARAAGFQQHITKPVRLSELFDAIRLLLTRPSQISVNS